MARLSLKLLALSAPALLLLAAFAALDPFRLFHQCDDYSRGTWFDLNRDFVSTEVFLRNRERMRYDSFVFGSSRSLAFQTREWRRHLPKDASPYHFDASGETVAGMAAKLRFLDRLGVPIRNALVVVCRSTTFRTSAPEGYLYRPDRRLSGEWAIPYYASFFRAFVDYRFLARLALSETPWASRFLARPRAVFDPVTNDLLLPDLDREIAERGDGYWESRPQVFVERVHQPPSPPLADAAVEALFAEVARVFAKNGTDFRVVISPQYDQQAVSAADVAMLRRRLGADRVFDYSGVNEITADRHNYYESAHYRPEVGARIMDEVYRVPATAG